MHLAVLADRVSLARADELPVFCRETTLVLFPDEEAVPAEEVDAATVTDVVVIDSKWGQAHGVLAHPHLDGCTRVRIGKHRTSYWRYHTAGVPEDGLCTVEAVYFLVRELHTSSHLPNQTCRCYDDLLWIFNLLHNRVMSEAKRRAIHSAADGEAES